MEQMWIAYHMVDEFGPFSGRQFFFQEPKVRSKDSFWVVTGQQGPSGTLFSIAGEFTVSAIDDDGPFKLGNEEFSRRADLKPALVPGLPLVVDKVGFERATGQSWEQFRRKVICGFGLRKAPNLVTDHWASAIGTMGS